MTRRQRRAFIQDARTRGRARAPYPTAGDYSPRNLDDRLLPLLEVPTGEVFVSDDDIRELWLAADDDEHVVLCCRAALGERNVPGIEPEFEHPVDARDECVRIITERRGS